MNVPERESLGCNSWITRLTRRPFKPALCAFPIGLFFPDNDNASPQGHLTTTGHLEQFAAGVAIGNPNASFGFAGRAEVFAGCHDFS
jgi:hypothetical protein